MKTANIIFWLIVAFVAYRIWRNSELSRDEKLAFIFKSNLGYQDGKWAKLSDKELNAAYVAIKQMQLGVDPDPEVVQKFKEIISKYGIQVIY